MTPKEIDTLRSAVKALGDAEVLADALADEYGFTNRYALQAAFGTRVGDAISALIETVRDSFPAADLTRELTFDEAEFFGLDGTGRDLDPRFPYTVFDVLVDTSNTVDSESLGPVINPDGSPTAVTLEMLGAVPYTHDECDHGCLVGDVDCPVYNPWKAFA